MNRDALLATLIGLALGLTITGILIVGPQLAKSFPNIKLPALGFLRSSGKSATPPENQAKTVAFSVTSPLPEAIEGNDQLVVSGTAQPQALVVVTGVLDDDVIAVGADGKYAGKITLAEGKNDIAVTQYIAGKPTLNNVTIYYTPENF